MTPDNAVSLNGTRRWQRRKKIRGKKIKVDKYRSGKQEGVVSRWSALKLGKRRRGGKRERV